MAFRREICSQCGSFIGRNIRQCAVCGFAPVRLIYQMNPENNPVSYVPNRFRGSAPIIYYGNGAPMQNEYGNGAPDYGYYRLPQRLRVQAPLRPPSAFGKKRALLCGITYGNGRLALKGSVNDVQYMKHFLINNLGFPPASILMLTDAEEENPIKIPTKYNMQKAMQWLVEGVQPGDSLVFHYSGHGSKEVDLDMDEHDGYDEALCPVDFEHEGKILDDEINAKMVRPLPHGAKLHAIIDTCYSGTVLDLPFMCRMKRQGRYIWQDQRNPSPGAAYKGSNGGIAVCFSACDDDGNAGDTSAFSGMGSIGALTYSFIHALQNEPKLSYGRLLNAMRSKIRETKEGIAALNGQDLSMDILQQQAHEPQLSCSEKFDIYTKAVVI